MAKSDFFMIYFVNEAGLYKLNVYAKNEQDAADFIKMLNLTHIDDFNEYMNTCSNMMIEEAKSKENSLHSFDELINIAKEGFMAGWKTYILQEEKNEEKKDFKQYISWWIRRFIDNHLENPPNK
mgnify:CR=1 FL=1